MKKQITRHAFLLLMIATMFMALTACSNNNGNSTQETTSFAPVELNITEISQSILDSGVFADELSQVDSSYSEMLMNITKEEYVSAMIYMGSGATAERLILFEAADNTAAAALEEKCASHVKEQTEAYAGYLPAEVDKLEHAILKTSGKYVILCVAEDYSKAEEMIQELFV